MKPNCLNAKESTSHTCRSGRLQEQRSRSVASHRTPCQLKSLIEYRFSFGNCLALFLPFVLSYKFVFSVKTFKWRSCIILLLWTILAKGARCRTLCFLNAKATVCYTFGPLFVSKRMQSLSCNDGCIIYHRLFPQRKPILV